MDSPIYLQWQQWENRIQEWLNQSNNDLELTDTLPFDRVILTLLTVKYQLLYRDVEKEMSSNRRDKHSERKATIILSKNKELDAEKKKERHRDREKLFDNFTGRLLSPEEVIVESSSEWKEFNQLCDWHGLAFIQKLEKCLSRFISELISMTSAYQQLIRDPPLVSPVNKIENEVYQTKNDGQVFLSVDMKSANFSLLQYLNAIDIHTYPTWSHFLSSFVGSRSIFTETKKLRMRCLGLLPKYYKLEALWIHFTATIYQKVLCRCLNEKDLPIKCVALTGDEVVFHLKASISDEKVIDLMEHMQRRLTKESPIVKFLVQTYRLRTFHWKDKHMCFARMFIGQNDKQFDLKCVPDKNKNYEQACKDFRMFFHL